MGKALVYPAGPESKIAGTFISVKFSKVDPPPPKFNCFLCYFQVEHILDFYIISLRNIEVWAFFSNRCGGSTLKEVRWSTNLDTIF